MLHLELAERLRGTLRDGKSAFGPFMKSLDPAFVEIAGYAGFDYAILDMEHGPAATDRLGDLIRAAVCGNIAPIVRVPDISEQSIGKALDLGACGVQIPQVSTAEEAERAVRFAKFFPRGERGVCRFVRAAGYSAIPRNVYFSDANRALLVLQLEGEVALRNLDDIISVDDVDVLFIGPYDLSQSLGVPGEVDNPRVTSAMSTIVEKAAAKGKTVGTFVDSIAAARRWMDAGIHYISYSVDVGIFREACASLVTDLAGGMGRS